MTDERTNLAELGRRWGMTRQTAAKMAREHEDFP
jgi:hypothetical protein